jgi:hypothetical protein
MYPRRPVGSVGAKEEIDPIQKKSILRNKDFVLAYNKIVSPRHVSSLQNRYVELEIRRSVFVLLESSVSEQVELASISQQRCNRPFQYY